MSTRLYARPGTAPCGRHGRFSVGWRPTVPSAGRPGGRLRRRSVPDRFGPGPRALRSTCWLSIYDYDESLRCAESPDFAQRALSARTLIYTHRLRRCDKRKKTVRGFLSLRWTLYGLRRAHVRIDSESPWSLLVFTMVFTYRAARRARGRARRASPPFRDDQPATIGCARSAALTHRKRPNRYADTNSSREAPCSPGGGRQHDCDSSKKYCP